jgi:hypothetical protein
MITDKVGTKGGKLLMNNVVEALKKGWIVSEVATVLARGANDEGRGYLVTFMEPDSYLLHTLYLPYSVEAEALLNQASKSSAR